jgi:hypothetical protein
MFPKSISYIRKIKKFSLEKVKNEVSRLFFRPKNMEVIQKIFVTLGGKTRKIEPVKKKFSFPPTIIHPNVAHFYPIFRVIKVGISLQ